MLVEDPLEPPEYDAAEDAAAAVAGTPQVALAGAAAVEGVSQAEAGAAAEASGAGVRMVCRLGL